MQIGCMHFEMENLTYSEGFSHVCHVIEPLMLASRLEWEAVGNYLNLGGITSSFVLFMLRREYHG
jgi:hypothetical protein